MSDTCGYSWEYGKFTVSGDKASICAVETATRAEEALRELLAFIHRDGGHHTAEVGLQRSYNDAEIVLAAWKDAFDEQQEAQLSRGVYGNLRD